MDRSIPLLVIGLVFGGGIGFTLAAGSGVTLDGHDHADPAQHDGDVAHSTESSAGQHRHNEMLHLDPGSALTLGLQVAPDPSSGWNLQIQTTSFRLAREHAGRDHVSGEGHAHFRINGVKLGRFYGPWVHLENLPAGEGEIGVTLNANDHRPLAAGDRPLSSSLDVEN